MSEQTSQEPTMEEILASIRRIISEDDAPAAEAAPPEAAPAPVAEEPAPAPAPPPAPVEAVADDTLDLTEKVETHGDLDVYTPEPVAAAPAPPPPAAPPPVMDDGLVGAAAASAAASAFNQLSAAIAMPAAGRTLEDLTREMLRPLLQQWLDQNLPAIVQQAVAAEVERIARGRVG